MSLFEQKRTLGCQESGSEFLLPCGHADPSLPAVPAVFLLFSEGWGWRKKKQETEKNGEERKVVKGFCLLRRYTVIWY